MPLGSDHTQHGKRVNVEDGKRQIFPAAQCEMDRMDFRDFMTAHALRVAILREVPFRDLEHTVAAIRAPSSNRETNYQYHEFVGDTVLKFVVSQFLYTSQPHWPEGFLTKRRVHLVSNERLAYEALRIGLDRYIITEPTRYRTWTPPSRSSTASDGRTLPTKVLADVLEALIGATFLDSDGDLEVARKCIHHLIPAVPLTDLPVLSRPQIPASAAASIVDVERLIGRTFDQKTLLLQALTLDSAGSQIHVESYQRLEFLGDAVLDLVVVRRLLRHQQTSNRLTQGKLTRLRAALVNAHLLGYFNLRFRLTRQLPTVYTNAETGDFQITTAESHVSLWHFLRHDSTDLTTAQQQCLHRYQDLSVSLQDSLNFGASYPWETLLALHPAKFHSDMIESVIGAIFVDSGGQLQPCEDFLTQIGMIEYLERLVRDNVDVVHPRDRLQQLLGSKEVSYDIESEGSDRLWGELTVDGAVRARTDGCLSKALVIAKLAKMGIKWLHNERSPDSGTAVYDHAMTMLDLG
ncbi:Dicer-like protein 2 [Elasticomyces elasticus]|nr:Dicer-like protein 2 [Elasticomyces elasticus]